MKSLIVLLLFFASISGAMAHLKKTQPVFWVTLSPGSAWVKGEPLKKQKHSSDQVLFFKKAFKEGRVLFAAKDKNKFEYVYMIKGESLAKVSEWLQGNKAISESVLSSKVTEVIPTMWSHEEHLQ
jgi:hypothetical protein